MLNWNTFEVILYWSLFAFAVFAIFYWQDNPSTGLTAFSFVAIWGYSKFHEAWRLEDKIDRLENSRKLLEEQVKERDHE